MKRKILIAVIVFAVVLAFILARRSQPQVPAIIGDVATNKSVQAAPAALETANQSNVESVGASSSPAPVRESVQARKERANRAAEAEIAMWQAPLIYFGKVVDESNQPIAGVQVSYNASAMDESRKEIQNTGTVTTDERGIFKIDGVKGIGLMLQLSHPNYYPYPENSTGFDKRSIPRKGYFSDSAEKAELFRMHSKGHPVPLVHRRGGADVPVNSGSATAEFYGQADKQVVGTLQIEAAGDTPKNWSPTPYDWSVRLTVPGGGLVESTHQFDFVAPDSGYQQSIEIDMGKDRPGWSDTVDKSYFVKLPNGYARMAIHMRAKTPLYTSLEYFFNPDGSTNLEPAQ